MDMRTEIATFALQALIAKSPFFDKHGEHGQVADILQFKLDLSRSAYDYADAMLAIRDMDSKGERHG